MLTLAIWWTTNLLEAALLGRAVQQRLIKAYPVFYTYLAYVLFESLSRLYMYAQHRVAYGDFYWTTQIVSVLLGYAVVWETYRQVLSGYPGAFRMARKVLLLIFMAVISKILVNILAGHDWTLARTMAEQERDFRAVQACLIAAVAGLMSYYRIPIGRNVRGIIIGYGLFLGTSILNLTLRSHFGEAFQVWWQYLQPAAYLVVLLTWCVTLWSFQPNPEPEPELDSRLEQDYQTLVDRTRQQFRQVRAHVGRAVRS